MYVCMYVCMYVTCVSMYICMHVCESVCMKAITFVHTNFLFFLDLSAMVRFF